MGHTDPEPRSGAALLVQFRCASITAPCLLSVELTFLVAGRWFNFEAVLVASPPPPSTSTTASSSPDSSTPQPPLQWTRFGTGDEDELFVFVCVRKPSTYDWEVPLDDEELIQGGRGQDGVDDQFERMLLGGMEWD